ncbi:MAG: CotH kinase family protein [Myxococcota bacterium]|nr:CotH kinase family protein [Myxococcota bacterium]
MKHAPVSAVIVATITFFAVAVKSQDDKQLQTTRFYNIDNRVTVTIEMKEDEFNALRLEEPCDGASTEICFTWNGARYHWRTADKVTIESSSHLVGTVAETNVGIRKKAWLGSEDKNQPALKLKFPDKVEDHIGTRHITLNNAKQDPAKIRQCLGYMLLERAGLPYSRCNFAAVKARLKDEHGNIIKKNLGLYVNVEPIKKRYIKHHFDIPEEDGEGNLYEIDHKEDFRWDNPNVWNIIARIDWKGFSDNPLHQDKIDLVYLINEISDPDGDIANAVDVDHFIKFWAMDVLLRNWDGYTSHINNAYIYNDALPVVDPSTAEDVNFKFLHWGIDQIYPDPSTSPQYMKKWYIYGSETNLHLLNKRGIIARELYRYRDGSGKQVYAHKLREQVYEFLGEVFNSERFHGYLGIKDYINTAVHNANDQLEALGLPPIEATHIDLIKNQIRDIRLEMNTLFGVQWPPGYVNIESKRYFNSCVRASGYQEVGTGYEVFRWWCTSSDKDQWDLIRSSDNPGYVKFRNRRYHPRILVADWHHAFVGPNGFVFNIFNDDPDNLNSNDYYDQYFGLIPHGSGYYEIQSLRTGLCLHFSDTYKTGNNQYQVHQSECNGAAENLVRFVDP